MLNIEGDVVTAPLRNFNIDLKPSFPEALCVFII